MDEFNLPHDDARAIEHTHESINSVEGQSLESVLRYVERKAYTNETHEMTECLKNLERFERDLYNHRKGHLHPKEVIENVGNFSDLVAITIFETPRSAVFTDLTKKDLLNPEYKSLLKACNTMIQSILDTDLVTEEVNTIAFIQLKEGKDIVIWINPNSHEEKVFSFSLDKQYILMELYNEYWDHMQGLISKLKKSAAAARVPGPEMYEDEEEGSKKLISSLDSESLSRDFFNIFLLKFEITIMHGQQIKVI